MRAMIWGAFIFNMSNLGLLGLLLMTITAPAIALLMLLRVERGRIVRWAGSGR